MKKVIELESTLCINALRFQRRRSLPSDIALLILFCCAVWSVAQGMIQVRSLHAAASLEVIRKTQHGVQNAPNCITRRSILEGITGDFVWAIIADRRDAKYPTTTYTDAASNFIMVRCSGAWPTSSGTSASSTAHHDHKVNFARHFITRRGLIVYEWLNMAKV